MLNIKVASNSICLVMISNCKDLNHSSLMPEKDFCAQFQMDSVQMKDFAVSRQVNLITGLTSLWCRLREEKSVGLRKGSRVYSSSTTIIFIVFILLNHEIFALYSDSIVAGRSCWLSVIVVIYWILVWGGGLVGSISLQWVFSISFLLVCLDVKQLGNLFTIEICIARRSFYSNP